VARRPVNRLLIVPQRRQALERIVLHATSLRIPIVEVEGGTLTALSGFDGHQGVALAVPPRVFAALEQVLARAIERREAPLVLVLDSLEDPQNFGTLLRSAEAAGAHGVVFPTRRQAPLTPAAIKASAGATEHLLLVPVDDLAATLVELHLRGLRIVGAEADAPITARRADLRGPLAIVIGSEGHGLSPAVRRRCDLAVRIPLRGSVGSLNAAVAGSILLFEAVAQREPGVPQVDGRQPGTATGTGGAEVLGSDAAPPVTRVEPGEPLPIEPAVETTHSVSGDPGAGPPANPAPGSAADRAAELAAAEDDLLPEEVPQRPARRRGSASGVERVQKRP
jgi:23S rRNA (guanosine2251-2'-O)-methyltransferase